MGDPFKPTYTSTIGVDFEIKQIKLPSGEECNLQCWDTAGLLQKFIRRQL